MEKLAHLRRGVPARIRTRFPRKPFFLLIALLSLAGLTAAWAAGISAESVRAALFSASGGSTAEQAHVDSEASKSEAIEATPSMAVGALEVPRSRHSATVLADGRVLIAGGEAAGSTEIYDAVTGVSAPSGYLSAARAGHTATRLADGRILIAGGSVAGVSVASTEVFDPATATFSAGPPMSSSRSGHTATVLSNGDILIAGGGSDTAEIFNGTSFTSTSGTMTASRTNASAIRMNDGRVFISGGDGLNGAEIYNPANSTFTTVGSNMMMPHSRALLRLLPDGKVQIIGGNSDGSMEVYDPSIDTIGAYAHVVPATDPCANLINYVLRAETRAALIYSGSTAPERDRNGHTITELGDKAIVVGGSDSGGNASGTITIFESSTATVTTDKLDYSPGDTAVISGRGFHPGEIVAVKIHEDPHTENERGLIEGNPIADANGNFSGTYLVSEPDIDMHFVVGARGQDSGITAQTTFTDANNDAHVAPGWAPINTQTTFSTLYRKTTGGTVQHVRITLPVGYTNISVAATAFSSGTWSTPVVNQVARTVDTQLTSGTGLATNNVSWARIDITATTPPANLSGNAADWLMQTFTNTAGTTGEQNDNPPVLIGNITNPTAAITFVDAGGIPIVAPVLQNEVPSTVRVRITQSGNGVKYTDVAVPTCFSSPSAVTATVSAGGNAYDTPILVTDGFIRLSGGAIATNGTLTVQFTTTPNCVSGTYLVSSDPSTNASNPPSGTNQSVSTTGGSLTIAGGLADLSITKTDSPDPVAPLGQITYTIGVSNAGPDDASAVKVVDTLPAGTALVSAAGANWTCNNTSGTVTCNRTGGNLAPGAAPNITIVVTAPSTSGSITNTATVSSPNDNTPGNNTATAATLVNTPPNCANDSGVTNEDVQLSDSVLCTDVDGHSLTYSVVTTTTNGLLTFNPDGSFTYQPNANYNGPDSFTFRANDGIVDSNTATYSITVNSINDDPTANDDTATVAEDSVNNAINVLGNDSFAPDSGETLTVTAASDPANGSTTFTATGVSYTPDANFFGTDTFTYTISDGNGGTDTATVTVTVTNVNDNPDAVDDTATVAEDSVNNAINVLANDSFAPDAGETLTVTAASDPANGSTTFTASGVNYTPDANFFGAHSFTYTIGDGNGGTDTATVTVTVTNVNDNPDAVDDTATVAEDSVNNAINVLTNDSFAPDTGETLTVTAVTQGTNGSVTFTASGVSYTPNSNFFGSDSFTYTISDGNGGSDTATVNVTVTNVNDNPVATDDTATVAEDSTNNAIDVLANDNDGVDVGETLAVTAVSDPPNGTAAFTATGVTYSPDANFFGTDSFTYTISDGNGGSATATVTVTVTNVNDAPVCVNGSASTNEDTPLNGNVSCSDIDGPSLTYSVVVGPTSGSLTTFNTSTGAFTYSPNANFNGADSFTFKANDGATDSNTATFNITVNAVNDAPVAVDDGPYSTTQDNSFTVTAPGVLTNDTDFDGPNALTAVLNAGPSAGTLVLNSNGSFTYTPNAGYVGPDSFTYRAYDGADNSNIATVSINVTAAVCTAPPADMVAWYPSNGNALDVMGGNNGTLSGGAAYAPGKVAQAFLFNGVNAVVTAPNTADLQVTSALTIDAWINPASMTQDHGAGIVAKGSFRTGAYAIDIIENGGNPANPRTLRFFLYDGSADTSYQVFELGWLTSDKVNTWRHIAATYDSTTGDLKLYDNGELIATASGVDKPVAGTLIGVNNHELSIGSRQSGNVTNTNGDGPYNLSFNGGIDEVEIFDRTLSAAEIKSIYDASIAGKCNTAPVANDDSYSTNEDTSLNVPANGVIGNDTDAEDNFLTASLASGPLNHASFSFNPDGSFSYTPNANFNGTDSFTYTVSDGFTTSNTATVTITVNSINDDPVANDDAATVAEDSVNNAIDVLANDNDGVDAGETLTVTAVSDPANGSAAFTATGVTYTPDANFFGTDTFTYTISDGNGGSDMATVTVTVTNVNDDPVANDDTATVAEDSVNNAIDVLANDNDGVDSGETLTVTAVSDPAKGTAAFTATGVTYTPDANFFGTDTFTYTISDGNGGSDTATVTVTVNNINDTPDAVDDTATVAEDSGPNAINVLANDTDADNLNPPANAGLSVTAVTQGANGGVTFTASGVSYAPNSNFYGSDSFTYTITDPTGLMDTATVNVTVTNVNDTPDAVDDSTTVNEDTTNNAINVLANDTDADNLTGPANTGLTVTAVTQGTNGSVGFTPTGVTYTPNANFFGSDSFTYTITDPTGLTDTATVNVTVNNVNDAPVCASDAGSTNEDTPLTDSVSCSDIDGPALTYSVVTSPASGGLSFNTSTGAFTYTPNLNFNGADSFTFKANDGSLDSNVATYSITVIAVNDPAVAVDDAFSTTEGNLLTVNAPGVLGNDTDVDNTAAQLSAVLDDNVDSGTLLLNSDGSFTYLPNAGFTGTDTFTYHANDGTANSNFATVTITVNNAVCVTRPTGMVAWYPGNGNPRDVIAGNNGTATGGAAYNTGKVSQAFNFDGANGVVTAPNSAALQVTSALTIDAWINPSTVTQDEGAGIVAKGSFRAGAYAIDMNSSGRLRFFFYTSDDNVNYQIYKDGWLTADKVGTWRHIAATYDSATGELKLYDNGALITGTVVNAPAPGTLIGVNDHELSIGSRQDLSAGNGTGPYTLSFAGGIDEVEIFNRALSALEIKSIFDASFEGKCNMAPVADDDAHSTNEDTPLNVPAPGVLAGDTDADLDTLTAILVSGPTNDASFTLNADGSFSYTPDANFNGSDSFTYKATDGINDSNVATVSITVNAINDGPDAVDDAATTNEDTAHIFPASGPGSLKNNDIDIDNTNAELFVSSVSDPPNGTAVVNVDGSVTYTPDLNFNGTDTFTYTLCDPGQDGSAATTIDNLCDTATVTMTVTAVNDGPDAVDDSATTNEETAHTFPSSGPGSLKANDTDVDNTNAQLSVTAVTDPPNGMAVLNGDGSVTYTPDLNFYGTDTFTYTLCDPGQDGSAATTVDNLCDTATVTITVNNINDTPDAVNDTATVDEDTVNNAIDVLANDTDADNLSGLANAGLTVTAVSDPANGSAAFTATGVTYTPDANFYGTDSFTYTACDAGQDGNVATTSDNLCDTATVSVTVNNINDTPNAVDDSPAAFVEDSVDNAINVLANDSDPDNLTPPANAGLSVTAVTQGAHGSVTFTATGVKYTPAPNYYGTDSFTYTISDGDGATDTATVSVTITNVNDTPDAVDDGATVAEDSGSNPINVLANDTDADNLNPPANAGLSVTAVTQGTNGSVTFTASGVSYAPNANFFGTDSFTYTISDSDGATDTATVNVTITNVNDTPDAVNDTATVNEDSVNNVIDVLANDTDADNLSGPANAGLTVTAASDPANGTAAFTATGVTYTPDANFFGTDTFTYTACDAASACDVATVTVTVTNVNDDPVANDDAATVAEDSVNNAIDVLANDNDGVDAGETLTVTAVSDPANGGAAFTATGVTYTPDANFFGTDTFTYTISDGNGGSDTATVTVTVTNVNDDPVANDDTATVAEDSVNNPIDVLANDNDGVDAGETLTVTAVSDPANGTAAFTATGVTYTPDANFFGSDSFTYTISDGNGGSATATVNVSVTNVNDTPDAVNDSPAAFVEDSTNNAIDVLANDSDPDNLTPPANAGLSVTAVTQGMHGMVTFTASGVSYTPNANYYGTDSFTYTISDGDGAADTATVNVTITNLNDTPDAVNDAATTSEDTAHTFPASGAGSLKGNDSDADNLSGPANAGLTVTSVSNPPNGSAVLNGDGSVTYTPDTNFNGTDTFSYTVCDSGQDGSNATTADNQCDMATVTMTVNAVNDEPVITSMDVVPTVINENDTATLHATFTDIDSSAFTLTINWGDGSPSQTVNCPTSCSSSGGVWTVAIPHQYLDDNPTNTPSDVNTVTLSVSDGGASDTKSDTVTVNNVNPIITSVSGPPAPIQIGSPATVTATFTDVGSLDTHTCKFSWDDGTPDTTVAAAGTGNGSCSASHTYSQTGVYTIGVTVTDDDTGAMSTTYQFVVVFDPSGGFVTGGGFINSPVGASTLFPLAVGKANFGFVSKYKRGSNIPEGQTEFQFHAGDLNFHSTSYDVGSLVVQGFKAQYKGTGTVNGAPGYKFVLTAYDGQVNGGGGQDKFRMKITLGPVVIYDNRMNTSDDIDLADPMVISSGSIVIHKGGGN